MCFLVVLRVSYLVASVGGRLVSMRSTTVESGWTLFDSGKDSRACNINVSGALFVSVHLFLPISIASGREAEGGNRSYINLG